MAAAADGVFKCIFEGCISGCDALIERRPYHRNCSCALHKSRDSKPVHCMSKARSLSYPMRKSWSERCLALHSASASASAQSSPSSSPAVVAVGKSRPLGSCNEGDDGQDTVVFFNV